MHLPKSIRIVEVGPRDGLQNEHQTLATEVKVAFIDRLSKTGLRTIEAASFVPPKMLPQMADGAEVLKAISQKQGVTYPVLVPNLKGLDNALDAGARAIQVIASSSETFSQKNSNCSIAQGLDRCAEIAEKAKKHNIKVRGYLSCCLGCPFEGETKVNKIVEAAESLIKAGCFEVALSDTNGVGTPAHVQEIILAVTQRISIEHLAVHFHDTYGQALANILAALELGIHVVDSSITGLGGCPYAKGATGNVATEDLLYMLNGLNIETGVDLSSLFTAGKYICSHLGKKSHSKVAVALGKE